MSILLSTISLLTGSVFSVVATVDTCPVVSDGEEQKSPSGFQIEAPDDFVEFLQTKATLNRQPERVVDVNSDVTPPIASMTSPRPPHPLGSDMCGAFPGCQLSSDPEYDVPNAVKYVDVNLLGHEDNPFSRQDQTQHEFVTTHDAYNEFVEFYRGVVDEEFDSFSSELDHVQQRFQQENTQRYPPEQPHVDSSSNFRPAEFVDGSAQDWEVQIRAARPGLDDSVYMLGKVLFDLFSGTGDQVNGELVAWGWGDKIAAGTKAMYEKAKAVGGTVKDFGHEAYGKVKNTLEGGLAFFIDMASKLKEVFDQLKEFVNCIMSLPASHSSFSDMLHAAINATEESGGFLAHIVPNTLNAIIHPFLKTHMKPLDDEERVDKAEGGSQAKNKKVDDVAKDTMGQIDQSAAKDPESTLGCMTTFLIKPAFSAAMEAITAFIRMVMRPLKRGFHFLMTKATGLLGKLVEKVGGVVAHSFDKAASVKAPADQHEQQSGRVDNSASEPPGAPINLMQSEDESDSVVISHLLRLAKSSASEYCLDQASRKVESDDDADQALFDRTGDDDDRSERTPQQHQNSDSKGSPPSQTHASAQDSGVFAVATGVMASFLKNFLGATTGMLFVPLLQKGIGFMSALLEDALSALDGLCGLFPEVGAGICSFVNTMISKAQRLTHEGLVTSGISFLEEKFGGIIQQAPALIKAILVSKQGGATELLDGEAHVLRVPEAFQPLVPHLMRLADLTLRQVSTHLDRCDNVRNHHNSLVLNLQKQLAEKDEELRRANEMLHNSASGAPTTFR